MRARRTRRPYVIAGFIGLLYGIAPILADRGSWMAWSWRTDAARVWQLVGGLFTGPAGRGLHTLDLLAVREGYLVFMGLPRVLAADLLQLVVGSIGRVLGLGPDRYEAFSRILERLGPAGSLRLWVVASAAVGALLGLLSLAVARALVRRLSTNRRRTS
jgi:hypothetical protein